VVNNNSTTESPLYFGEGIVKASPLNKGRGLERGKNLCFKTRNTDFHIFLFSYETTLGDKRNKGDKGDKGELFNKSLPNTRSLILDSLFPTKAADKLWV
jgi:hypothetical protein